MLAHESRLASSHRVSYDLVADEYYDPICHPTCRNFREASEKLVERSLSTYDVAGKRLLEVGAGDSLLARIVWEQCGYLEDLVLTDASEAMLAHSKHWIQLGADYRIGSACDLPIAGESVDLLVASLGDPFNDIAFWNEVNRVLVQGGLFVFTTPSWEWAAAFRSQEKDGMFTAAFDLLNGGKLLLPSLIYPVDEQVGLISAAQLEVADVSEVPLESLTPPYSQKLQVLSANTLPIATAYLGRRVRK